MSDQPDPQVDPVQALREAAALILEAAEALAAEALARMERPPP